jgi:hypothetical protein
LVGTRGVLKAAANAFQPLQDIFHFHAFHQGADALRVAVAATVKLHILQDAVLDFKLNGLAAGALGAVSVFHWIIYWLSAFSNQLLATHYQADS